MGQYQKRYEKRAPESLTGITEKASYASIQTALIVQKCARILIVQRRGREERLMKKKKDRSIIYLEKKGERPGHYGSPGCSLGSKRGKRPPTGGLLSFRAESRRKKRKKSPRQRYQQDQEEVRTDGLIIDRFPNQGVLSRTFLQKSLWPEEGMTKRMMKEIDWAKGLVNSFLALKGHEK